MSQGKAKEQLSSVGKEGLQSALMCTSIYCWCLFLYILLWEVGVPTWKIYSRNSTTLCNARWKWSSLWCNMISKRLENKIKSNAVFLVLEVLNKMSNKVFLFWLFLVSLLNIFSVPGCCLYLGLSHTCMREYKQAKDLDMM